MTVQNPLSREVFWHEYAKIPRHARQNSITKGDFIEFWIRVCEGTEQIRSKVKSKKTVGTMLFFTVFLFFTRHSMNHTEEKRHEENTGN